MHLEGILEVYIFAPISPSKALWSLYDPIVQMRKARHREVRIVSQVTQLLRLWV